jgi:hypothetical protein
MMEGQEEKREEEEMETIENNISTNRILKIGAKIC